MPAAVRSEYTRSYPFGWFGILVRAAPYSKELVYAHHDRGFSLVSTRSSTVQRLYLQCDPTDHADAWGDERIWAELDERLSTRDGWTLPRGEIFQKGVIAMRSFVVEPMAFGDCTLLATPRIVPPTGAKGMNLAVADADPSPKHSPNDMRPGRSTLNRYSSTALARVWSAAHFSWWMTSMLHRFSDDDPFGRRMQLAELRKVMGSSALQAALAEQYVGVPLPGTAGYRNASPARGRHRSSVGRPVLSGDSA